MEPFAKVLALLMMACSLGKAANVHPPAASLKLNDSLIYLVTPMVKTPSGVSYGCECEYSVDDSTILTMTPGGNGAYAIIKPLTDGATTITVQLGGEFELNYNVIVEPETNNSPEGLRTIITAMEPERGN